ncbi:vacuolar protein-like protein sorting 24, partial [Tribonema minus]
KKVDPQEQAKEWNRTMNREIRTIERQIKSMDNEEAKLVRDIKKLAKEGSRNERAVRVLARQMVTLRQTKTRMYEGKVQIHSVQMQLKNQLALVKVTGCLSKSTEVMQMMGKLVSIPELQATMTDLAREMERAGLTEEILGDAMEDTMGTNEDEVDQEVEKVLAEITATTMAGAEEAPVGEPQVQVAEQEQVPAEAEQEDPAELASM